MIIKFIFNLARFKNFIVTTINLRSSDNMKRVFDFLVSLFLIIMMLPIFLIVMIAIKLTSEGPVFFTQRRIGKDNREFLLYKFRTMRVNTPNVATHLLKDPNQFITPIGGFLRKSSLDELPQLLNILKGDMTFIGPRPALYNQYDLKEMRTECGVHRILPGVTGWAQINGRDGIDIVKKVKYDEHYLLHRSVVFDIRILLLTASRVLRADGVLEGGIKEVSADKYKENASI